MTALGGIGSETLDKFLEFLSFLFPLFKLIFGLPLEHLAHLIPKIVVPRIGGDLPKVNIADLGAYRIEKMPIVGTTIFGIR